MVPEDVTRPEPPRGLREIVLGALARVGGRGTFLHEVLARAFEKRAFPPRFRGLAVDLASGILRRRLTLDHLPGRLYQAQESPGSYGLTGTDAPNQADDLPLMNLEREIPDRYDRALVTWKDDLDISRLSNHCVGARTLLYPAILHHTLPPADCPRSHIHLS